jgi:glycosyltransferase involved in cell wall biosynthesis
MNPSRPRVPLLYVLHSGNLYGTERIALATASGLADEYAATIFAPAGPVIDEARRRGLQARAFDGSRDLAAQMWPWFRDNRNRRIGFIATGVSHSLIASMLSTLSRCSLAHLQVVGGGTDERLSYGRKHLLNRLGVRFVAVSAFVRERLIRHRVRADRVAVIENFLSPEQIAAAPRRACFERAGVRRVIVISRTDPIKQIDLLLDTLDHDASLRAALEVRVLGAGSELETLRARAASRNPNVSFAGFVPEVASELAASDLLVHLCPVEPFGLAILESMAANVPVLVPDSGGAGALIDQDVTGFHFRAGSADDLGRRLRELAGAPHWLLNRVADGGRRALESRFSAAARIDDYRELLGGRLQ